MVRKIDLKPLSVNECWQGRRFKTAKYRQYERVLLFLLPKITMPDPPFQVFYEFGFSNMMSDIDNPVKPLQDILQKKYKFNDHQIHEMTVKKKKVKKGGEYIRFEIKGIEPGE